MPTILSNPTEHNTETLFLREVEGKNAYETESRKVYSYILFSNQGTGAVVVNLSYDEVLQEISSMDILNESRLLIINEQNERLVDVQTVLIDEAEELRDKIHDMVEKGERNGEALAAGGGRYFISYLYSAESRWHYIKITRWDAVFGILRTLGEWTVGIVLVIILLMLLVVIKSSISIVRLQTIMQKRQSPGLRQADINQLKEGFLSDFLHSRKLFTKSQLREQMEKFGFAVSDEKQYMALLL